jgi:C-terminal processing protease CtpA/Prc
LFQGKLGIVIDTTQDGPMVNQVKEGSPLKGLLQVGDIIAKVNDVDTRAMSGAAITSLMVRTAKQTRLLTVLGKEYEK